jgi:glyoxylase I family protein
MPDVGNLESSEASQTGAIQVAGLDHLVLRVADLDRAIRFYEQVLGCHVERRLDQPKLVQLRAGASMIDLVPAGPPPQSADAAAGRNLDHFAVRIATSDSTLYITDPDGNVVELKGPPERAE